MKSFHSQFEFVFVEIWVLFVDRLNVILFWKSVT